MATLTPEQEEYKKKQREKMHALVEGAKDPVGYTITHIYTREDEFVIYDAKTSEGRETFRVYIETEIEEDPKDLEGNYRKIRPKYIQLRGCLHKADNQRHAKGMAAVALAVAIKGETDRAESMIDEMIGQINKEYADTIRCKLAYLISCMSWLIITSLIGAIVYLNRKSELATANPDLLYAFFCCLFAGFGGFISVTRKLYQLQVEKDVRAITYIIYAIERMIIANLSGLVVYVIIKCGIVLSFVNELSHALFGYMALSIISGFSENYIPDLLIKIQEQ